MTNSTPKTKAKRSRMLFAAGAVLAAVLVRAWFSLRRATGQPSAPAQTGDPADLLRPVQPV